MGTAVARMGIVGVRRAIVEQGVRRRLDGVVGVGRMRRQGEGIGVGVLI